MNDAQTVVPGYDEEWNPVEITIEVKDAAASVERLSAPTDASAQYFTIDGRRGQSRGLSIVRMSDGTVKKVMIQ